MLLFAILASILPTPLVTAASDSWQLVWSDEFDGNSLNTDYWVYDIGTGEWGWGNNELQYYTNRKENVEVKNGNLIITARKENYGGMNYTSGRIKTKGKISWKYGKIEARIKIPTGQGVWPAFWMLGDNQDQVGWPKCGEIDIMEHVNNEPYVHGTIHWDYNGHQWYGNTSGNLDFSQYHVYSIEWDEKSIKWFVDGVQFNEADITINNTEEFHNSFFILLNLAIGGNWPGSPDASTTFPKQMFVDYIRVYQKGGSSGGGNGGGNGGGGNQPSDLNAAKNAAYNWLVAQQVPSGNALRGFVDSFEDHWADGSRIQIAYTYDQAIAAISFTLMKDYNRARQVLDMLKATQDPAGFWINSYWWNNGYGEEIRAHIGPCLWVALAVMNYEKLTGDMSYHDMAIKTIDWCLQFQKPNGGIGGGLTTWDSGNGSWTEEVWSSTEHNIDAYAALTYFSATTPSRQSTYSNAANKVKNFLDNVVWDNTKNRWYGGYRNNTGTLDTYVPMDVNPWGVMALGTSGTRNYGASISYVENANGNPGTLSNPRYVHTLPYAGTTITGYDFDWQSDGAEAPANIGGGYLGPDIWFEGTAFMSIAYSILGNEAKSDSILHEIIKKQGKDGSMNGGIPYSLYGTNNNYWRMSQQNCVSSTGWFIIAASKWNPFKGESTLSGGDPGNGGQPGNGDGSNKVATPTFSLPGGTYPSKQEVTISCATEGAAIRYTTDGSTPTNKSKKFDGNKPIKVDKTMTIKAIATKNGMEDSDIAIATYVIGQDNGGGTNTVSTPYFFPAAGTYPAPQSVSIICDTPGVTIRYTTDGSTPTESSPQYTVPFTVSSNVTIKAIAFKDGMNPSPVATATYIISGGKSSSSGNNDSSTNTVATPIFSMPGGTYSSKQEVFITCETEGATIRYTTDGSTPTERSKKFTDKSIKVDKSMTIKAIAIKSGLADSDVAIVTYTINSGKDAKPKK